MSAMNLLPILVKSNDILKSYEKRANLLADSIRVNFNEPYTLFIKKLWNGKIHVHNRTITIVAVPDSMFSTYTIGFDSIVYDFDDIVYKKLRKLDKIHWDGWDCKAHRLILRPVENSLSNIITMPFEKVQFIKVE